MSNPGTPYLDPNFYIYDSYVSDPPYQVKFTIAWTALTALCVFLSVPKLLKAWRTGRLWQTWAVKENVYNVDYKPVDTPEKIIPRTADSSTFNQFASIILKCSLCRVPYLNLNVGQILISGLYFGVTLFCIFYKSPIVFSPNRAGFIALAQLPFIFLFACKNSILSVLLGLGYEKVNFLHRWAGRILFFSITIHGGLWINNDRTAGTPIIGSAKETLGVAAYGLLGTIFLTSLPPVRKHAYQMFTTIHIIGYVSFFIVICYHTLYAIPWIFPPIAFYGFDLLARLLRTRIKEAILIPIGDQMTLIHIQGCDGGWIAGQHLRLRVFFSGRMLESHPLTIANSPSPVSCISSGEIILGVRVNGDWSHALNEVARRAEKQHLQVSVMLDGPYGGSSIDLGNFENAILIAGGSGITFTLGLLDDIVGRVVNMKRKGGEKTRRVKFVWCIKSFGSISWFAPMLVDIALKAQSSSITLHIEIFVTCLCDPESVPVIPNCEVSIEKPRVAKLLDTFLNGAVDLEAGKRNKADLNGLALAVSGPKSLTTEAQSTVAKLSIGQMRRIGNVALHTEEFSL